MEVKTRGGKDKKKIRNGRREDERKDGWGQMEATDRVIRQRAGRVKYKRKSEEKVKGGRQEVS